MQLTIRLKTKTIIVGICVCSMRTADGGDERGETFAVRMLLHV